MTRELLIAAADFANELTTYNALKKGLRRKQAIKKEEIKNSKTIRNVLIKRAVNS